MDNNNNKWIRIVLIIIMIVYIVSPIDVLPGPIDDSIITILGLLANKKLLDSGKEE